MKVYVLHINQKIDKILYSVILNKFEKINPNIKNVLDRQISQNRTSMYLRIPEDKNIICGASRNNYDIHTINYFNNYGNKMYKPIYFVPPYTKPSELVYLEIHDLI